MLLIQMTDDDDMIIVITVSCRKAFLYFGFYWGTVDLLQCGIQRQKPLIQTLLIFCSVAFREKNHSFGHCWSFVVWHSERKAALQAGIQALLNAQRKREPPELKLNTRPYTTQLAVPQQNRPKRLGRKIPTRKPPPTRKGFLLPYKVNTKGSWPWGLAIHPPGKAFSYPTR